MNDEKMISEYPTEQRIAVCRSAFNEKLATEKISFDYDETLTTAKGMRLAMDYIEKGVDVYIISARQEKDGMLNRANRIGIPESRIYATGSNKAKIEKIKELEITIHYDNNKDVLKELGEIGRLI
jgi:soluble P-type ATPase